MLGAATLLATVAARLDYSSWAQWLCSSRASTNLCDHSVWLDFGSFLCFVQFVLVVAPLGGNTRGFFFSYLFFGVYWGPPCLYFSGCLWVP